MCIDPAYLAPDQSLPMIEAATRRVTKNPAEGIVALFEHLDGPKTPPFLRVMHLRRGAGTPEHVIRQTMIDNVATALRSNSKPVVADRSCPVLTIGRDVERLDLGRSLAQDPRSRAIDWSPGGHWHHQERPEEFNSLVGEWLRALDLAPR